MKTFFILKKICFFQNNSVCLCINSILTKKTYIMEELNWEWDLWQLEQIVNNLLDKLDEEK